MKTVLAQVVATLLLVAAAAATDCAAQAAATYRRVSFFDLACRKIVPLALFAELPADFEIRAGGYFGCFAGNGEDLARLLKVEGEADFDALRRGVIWVRVSMSTQYDPLRRHFVSDQGSDEKWREAWTRTAGATDVEIVSQETAGMPSLRVNASVRGKPLRMFYLGVGDSCDPDQLSSAAASNAGRRTGVAALPQLARENRIATAAALHRTVKASVACVCPTARPAASRR